MNTLFGWPTVILAFLLATTGLIRKRALFLVLGAIVSLPFALYLAATPRFQVVGFLLPLLFLGAAYCLKRGIYWLAWLLILPYVVLMGWLANEVSQQ